MFRRRRVYRRKWTGFIILGGILLLKFLLNIFQTLLGGYARTKIETKDSINNLWEIIIKEALKHNLRLRLTMMSFVLLFVLILVVILHFQKVPIRVDGSCNGASLRHFFFPVYIIRHAHILCKNNMKKKMQNLSGGGMQTLKLKKNI